MHESEVIHRKEFDNWGKPSYFAIHSLAIHVVAYGHLNEKAETNFGFSLHIIKLLYKS